MPEPLTIPYQIGEAALALLIAAGKPADTEMSAFEVLPLAPDLDQKRIDIFLLEQDGEDVSESRTNPLSRYVPGLQIECRVRSASQAALSPLEAWVHTQLMGNQGLGGLAKKIVYETTVWQRAEDADGTFWMSISVYRVHAVGLKADMRVTK